MTDSLPDISKRTGKTCIAQVLARTAQRVTTVTPGDPGFPVPPQVVISQPNTCQTCKGFGWLRLETQVGDPNFGRLSPCPDCREPILAEQKRSSIYAMSSLPDLTDLTFENFLTNKSGYSVEQVRSLQTAKERCTAYAQDVRGWLVIAGPYGCGKTHLAAAIANTAKLATLFITLPDMLDQLRAGFDNTEFSYQERFQRMLEIPLLVVDDMGAENPSGWTSEKIFQLVNTRYIRSLPTVYTTNKTVDEIDGRIASRLMDVRLTQKVAIMAPDYRRVK